ncbi:MAG: hypothetical protein AB8B61_03155 [Cyclobacteriaceae bacterium]
MIHINLSLFKSMKKIPAILFLGLLIANMSCTKQANTEQIRQIEKRASLLKEKVDSSWQILDAFEVEKYDKLMTIVTMEAATDQMMWGYKEELNKLMKDKPCQSCIGDTKLLDQFDERDDAFIEKLDQYLTNRYRMEDERIKEIQAMNFNQLIIRRADYQEKVKNYNLYVEENKSVLDSYEKMPSYVVE